MNSLLKRGAHLLLAWGLLSIGTQVQAGTTAVDVQALSIAVAGEIDILTDAPADVRVQDLQSPQWQARFAAPTQQDAAALALGFHKEPVWLRLRLSNPTQQPLTRVLEIAHAGLNDVLLAMVSDGVVVQQTQTGTSYPFASRSVANRHFCFSLEVPAQSQPVVYLRVQSSYSLVLPVRLWEPGAFARSARDDYVGQAWYFGMASAMLAFNLLLFLALRDRVYLIYVAFVAATALTIAAGNGMATEFMWPNHPWLAQNALMFTNNITIGLLLLFMRSMLDSRTHLPRADRVLVALTVLMFSLPAVAILVGPGLFAISTAINGFTSLLMLAVAVLAALDGRRIARIFLLAYLALMAGGLASILLGFKLVPANVLTLNGVQIGSALEMLLLALALADRLSESRRAAHKAQGEALASERRLVETLRTSERRLEERVAERTAALTSAMERLKRAQAELVQSEKLASLGSLVAGIAHELNTPIGNAVTVATTMEEATRNLKADIEGAGMRKSTLLQYLENVLPMSELIVRSTQRAASLVASFKRVAVDQTSEQRRMFDVRELAQDICASLRPGYKHQPWLIEVDMPPDLTCNSYPGPLGQVITNIVQNAVLHAFAGRKHGMVRLTARQVDRAIELTIADDGNGMPAAVLARIFDPFFTTRLGQGGSGLGLSISRNIVTGVLGGTLQAFSEPGLGASFVLTFPQEPSPESGPHALESAYGGLH